MMQAGQRTPRQHPWRLVGALFFIGLAPALLYITQLDRPTDSVEALHIAGSVFGVAGLSLLALSAFCTLRHPRLENLTSGLDNLYRLHHLAGLWSIVLIVGHISLLTAANYLSSPEAASYLFKVWQQPWELLIGWASLVLLCIVAMTASTLDRGSHFWRFIHLLSLPAYLFALYHFHFLTVSTGVVKILLLALFFIGLCAGFLRSLKYIFSYRYRVESVEHISSDITCLTLVPEGRPLKFRESQYVFAAFHTACGYSGCNEFHPFTITSTSNEGIIELIVKARGDCSCTLQHIVPGVPAHLEGAFGGFRPDSLPQVWIGGGIGITPFLPLLKSASRSGQSIDVYYVARSKTEHVLLPRLTEASQKNPLVTIHAVEIQEDIDRFMLLLSERTPDFTSRSFLLSGPPQMVRQIEGHLSSFGVSSSRIKQESFGIL